MTPAAPSPELRAFLAAWLAWAEGGAPNKEPFDRSVGLCLNMPRELKQEFKSLRISDFPSDWVYPFGGSEHYDKAEKKRTQHLNPARLAWVREVLGRSA
jgi:hypothetical protein